MVGIKVNLGLVLCFFHVVYPLLEKSHNIKQFLVSSLVVLFSMYQVLGSVGNQV